MSPCGPQSIQGRRLVYGVTPAAAAAVAAVAAVIAAVDDGVAAVAVVFVLLLLLLLLQFGTGGPLQRCAAARFAAEDTRGEEETLDLFGCLFLCFSVSFLLSLVSSLSLCCCFGCLACLLLVALLQQQQQQQRQQQ